MNTSSEVFFGMRLYLEINVMLAVALILFTMIRAGASKFNRRISSVQLLRLGKMVLFGALVLPLASRLLPQEMFVNSSVQVWSPLSDVVMDSVERLPSRPRLSSDMSLPDDGPAYLALVFLAGLLLSLANYFRKLRTLRKRLVSGHCIKTHGRVTLLAVDGNVGPYSVWSQGRAYVVLPMRLLGTRDYYRVAVRHEIQHHRQGDTIWAHGFAFLAAFFFWNPAIYSWIRILSELQEFACDEVLIGRRNISPRAYGRCLIEVAKMAVGARRMLAGTAGMASSSSGRLLKRRIEMMFEERKVSPGWWRVACLGFGTFIMMAGVAFASRGVAQDRTITMTQAKELAEKASRDSVIPITVNELVLARLNRYAGTSGGRRQMRESLKRMESYRPMIERKLSQYELPSELLAIPLFESGYRNDRVSSKKAAGLWQFIPQTARNYDLKVDQAVDERLNPEKLTDAAMRYYRDLNGIFGDWRLALKAYNEGERRVQDLIRKLKTRDPWQLEKHSSTEGYLSGAMAMMIIMKNPELVR